MKSTKYIVLDEENPESDSIPSLNDSDQTKTENILTDETTVQKPAETRFPFRELLIVYFITASDSIALTIAQPFIPDLCRYRFGIAEEYVGIASGILVGGFSLAAFCSSFFIGHLSDIYGRKPFLLMGLVSGAVCTFIFGLSPNFGIAIAIRLIAGLTDGNNGLCKSVISDITTGKHRAVGFAYMGASFSIARAISSAVSGLTTGVIIAKNVPVLNDPYILPCLLGGSVNFLSLILTAMYIPETNKGKKKKSGKAGVFGFIPGIKEIMTDPLQRRLNICCCLNSFANGALLLGLVLLFSLQIDYHGLGFTPFENGIIYAWFGAVSALFQIFFFKKVLMKLNVMRTYLFGTILLGCATILTPCTSLIYWIGGYSQTTRILTWIFLIIIDLPLSIGFMTALPVVNSMQSNAANPARVGLVQGTAQSLSSGLRSFGPVVAGLIFSASVAIKFPFLLFWVLGVIYSICFMIAKNIPKKDIRRCEGETEEVELKDTVPKVEEGVGLLREETTNADVVELESAKIESN